MQRICAGESVTQGDTTYRTSGIYLKTFKTTEGCDSTIATNLTVNNAQQTTQSFKLCTGESITVGDTTYRTTGQYTKRLTAFGGCDILVTSNVLVNIPKQTNQAFTICNSQSITVGDTTYRTAGIYLKKLKTTEGCDSVVTTQLTIQNEVTFNQKLKICEGTSVAVGDTTYKTNGIFIKKLRSASGCDSVITTEVTVIKFDIITSNDTLINLGDSLRLFASINPPLSVSWKWTPTNTVKCDTCPTTWAKPNATTQYQVEILEKENKCRKTSRITVRTKSGCDIYIPTAFSPNGDKVNDVFALYPSACLKRIKRFVVFNRWGNLIVARNDIAIVSNQEIEMWDGTMNGSVLDTGTFVYVVEAEFINGQSEVISGDFSIVK